MCYLSFFLTDVTGAHDEDIGSTMIPLTRWDVLAPLRTSSCMSMLSKARTVGTEGCMLVGRGTPPSSAVCPYTVLYLFDDGHKDYSILLIMMLSCNYVIYFKYLICCALNVVRETTIFVDHNGIRHIEDTNSIPMSLIYHYTFFLQVLRLNVRLRK